MLDVYVSSYQKKILKKILSFHKVPAVWSLKPVKSNEWRKSFQFQNPLYYLNKNMISIPLFYNFCIKKMYITNLKNYENYLNISIFSIPAYKNLVLSSENRRYTLHTTINFYLTKIFNLRLLFCYCFSLT